jgi:iron complex outermembrane receptor protein
MPLNARVALTQRLGGWTGTAEVLMVDGQIARFRRAQRAAHCRLRPAEPARQLRVEAGAAGLGIDNLFDRFYNHPQGGAYLGQGRTMAATAVPWGVSVPGMGRSVRAIPAWRRRSARSTVRPDG